MFNLTEIYKAVGGGGLDFSPQDRLEISSQAHVTILFDFDDPADFTQILLELDSDCKYRWDDSSSDTISADDDLTLYANTTYQITIPFKLANRLGKDLFLHLKQVSSVATKFARFVKI